MAINFAQWGNDLYTGRRSYDIVGRRRLWFVGAAVLVLLSVAVLVVKGLEPGIEFRGGSEFTVASPADTSQQIATDTVRELTGSEDVRVSKLGESSLRIQTEQLSQAQVEELRKALAEAYQVELGDVASAFVGPTWGKDVSTKAIRGVVVFLLLVSLVMTAYFRTWRMALAAVVALLCDLTLTVGIYALSGFEVTPATVIGLMTILAYSIYDTVVVFDKVRENTRGVTDQTRSTYAERANLAVNQTLVRSINTSVVAVLPVAAILFVGAFLLGAGTLRDISLALFVGMIVGAFSSIFLATPLEVAFQERGQSIREHTAKVLEARARQAEESGMEPDAARLAAMGVGAGRMQLIPGQHLGTQAQPRRKKKKR
jgi:protein-export membrane protein, SecD/SecF family